MLHVLVTALFVGVGLTCSRVPTMAGGKKIQQKDARRWLHYAAQPISICLCRCIAYGRVTPTSVQCMDKKKIRGLCANSCWPCQSTCSSTALVGMVVTVSEFSSTCTECRNTISRERRNFVDKKDRNSKYSNGSPGLLAHPR